MENKTLNDTDTPASYTTEAAIQLSRNELESLCAKAARGAGMSWGFAEEVAFASGWLASRGVDVLSVLAGYLPLLQEKTWENSFPVVHENQWQARRIEQALCPVVVGATLSDYANVQPEMFEGKGLVLSKLNFPCLLLPFIAMIAKDLNRCIYMRMQKNHGAVYFSSDSIHISDKTAFVSCKLATVSLSIDDSQTTDSATALSKDCEPLQTIGARLLCVPSLMMDCIQQLALRTTVPPSLASRANAGASGSDND